MADVLGILMQDDKAADMPIDKLIVGLPQQGNPCSNNSTNIRVRAASVSYSLLIRSRFINLYTLKTELKGKSQIENENFSPSYLPDRAEQLI